MAPTTAALNKTAGGNAAFHNFNNDFAHISDPNERRRLALAEIDKALDAVEKQLKSTGPAVAGLSGEFDRWKNWALYWTGAKTDETSAEFKARTLLFEAELPRMLGLSGRVSVDERARLREAVGALARGTSPAQAQKQLALIRNILARDIGEAERVPEDAPARGGFTPDASGWVTLPGGVRIREKPSGN